MFESVAISARGGFENQKSYYKAYVDYGKNLCVKKQFILKCGWQLLQFFKPKPSQNWKLQGNLFYFDFNLFCRFEDLQLPIYRIQQFDFDLKEME